MVKERQLASEPTESDIRCCLCRNYVTLCGWCEHCERWAFNVTPRRWDEAGHAVGPDGWGFQCGQFVMTELLPEHGQWRDTRIVPVLVPRAENQRRMGALWRQLERLLAERMRSGPATTVEVEDPRIAAHTTRLVELGLDNAQARKIASDMVSDAAHVATCALCQRRATCA